MQGIQVLPASVKSLSSSFQFTGSRLGVDRFVGILIRLLLNEATN